MRSMRQMNSMMNSMFADPFGGMGMFDMHQQHQSALTGAQHHQRHSPLMPFGFSSMPNINRFMNLQIPDGATSYSSSQVVKLIEWTFFGKILLNQFVCLLGVYDTRFGR